MHTRRQILINAASLLAGAAIGSGVEPQPVLATPAMMRAAIRKVVGEAPLRKGKVKLDLPPLIENGNAVPMTISVESPMTTSDHVKAIITWAFSHGQYEAMADNHRGTADGGGANQDLPQREPPGQAGALLSTPRPVLLPSHGE